MTWALLGVGTALARAAPRARAASRARVRGSPRRAADGERRLSSDAADCPALEAWAYAWVASASRSSSSCSCARSAVERREQLPPGRRARACGPAASVSRPAVGDVQRVRAAVGRVRRRSTRPPVSSSSIVATIELGSIPVRLPSACWVIAPSASSTFSAPHIRVFSPSSSIRSANRFAATIPIRLSRKPVCASARRGDRGPLVVDAQAHQRSVATNCHRQIVSATNHLPGQRTRGVRRRDDSIRAGYSRTDGSSRLSGSSSRRRHRDGRLGDEGLQHKFSVPGREGFETNRAIARRLRHRRRQQRAARPGRDAARRHAVDSPAVRRGCERRRGEAPARRSPASASPRTRRPATARSSRRTGARRSCSPTRRPTTSRSATTRRRPRGRAPRSRGDTIAGAPVHLTGLDALPEPDRRLATGRACCSRRCSAAWARCSCWRSCSPRCSRSSRC